MFKNLHVFRIDGSKIDVDAVEKALEKETFNGIGSQDMLACGWVNVRPESGLVYRQERHILMRYAIEKRLLPGSVVKRKLAEAVEALTRKIGHKPGRKQIRDLKEEIIRALIPRALTDLSFCHLWIDLDGGWFVTDGKPDAIVSAFTNAFKDVLPEQVNLKRSPAVAMMDWLMNADSVPAVFTVDDECELRSPEKEAVRYSRLNLDRDDLRAHIGEGKLPVKLAMTHDDKVSFLLTEKFEFKKIDHITLEDEPEPKDEVDESEAFAADFALMNLSIPSLLADMVEAINI